jgi:hypothetical protein
VKSPFKFVLLLALGSSLLLFGADVGGILKGRITFNVPTGQQINDVTLILKTDGSNLRGTFSAVGPDGKQDSTEILDGKLNDTDISFDIATGASDVIRMNFTGKQEGDALRLVATAKNPNDGREWKFVDDLLKREK